MATGTVAAPRITRIPVPSSAITKRDPSLAKRDHSLLSNQKSLATKAANSRSQKDVAGPNQEEAVGIETQSKSVVRQICFLNITLVVTFNLETK